MKFLKTTIALMAILILTSCGGSGGQNLLEPSFLTSNNQTNTNRHVWGLWEVRISSDHQSVEIIPHRVSKIHLNVVYFLETLCADCLSISNITKDGPNKLSVDVTLEHPFEGLPQYTGFDVRGVFITDTDYTFPTSGKSIVLGTGIPKLVSPDGYTSLFNPTDFPETEPEFLGYIKGKYSNVGNLSATLNPFMVFKKNMPRRMFESGASETKTFELDVPVGPFSFGYVVDASWKDVGEVIDPLIDFPEDANCLEAYEVSVIINTGLTTEPISYTPIQVLVFDHQGLDTISTVTIEVPGIINNEIELEFSDTVDNSYLFTGIITNELEADEGKYPLLVRVVDTQSDDNLGQIDAWYVSTIEVVPKSGWAKTWGSGYFDTSNGVITDEFGNVYATGSFQQTVDFDPGPGTEYRSSNGQSDVFLSKFNYNGDFLWVFTWGGPDEDVARGIVIDDFNNLYITGGDSDIFLIKLDSNNNLEWLLTWGGAGNDSAYDINLDDSNSIYISGAFQDSVDFDPGLGVDTHTSNGGFDMFLSKLDSDGNFQWAKTWGGMGLYYDKANGVVFDNDNIYVSGVFQGFVDFDPDNIDYECHTSLGYTDAFLSKFNPDGNFQWVRTWGGSGNDFGLEISSDDYNNIYVVGYFQNVADFDPDSVDEEIRVSVGSIDSFLSKFDSSGDFQWVRAWGGSADSLFLGYVDAAYNIDFDCSGNIYVAGELAGVLWFEGIPYEDKFSQGKSDVILLQTDDNGDLQWANVWGGDEIDRGFDVAIDTFDNIFISGIFQDIVDFNPGLGIEEHVSNGDYDAFISKFLPGGVF